MCSAIQPRSRAIQLAIRNAKHFFPSSASPFGANASRRIIGITAMQAMRVSLLIQLDEGADRRACPR